MSTHQEKRPVEKNSEQISVRENLFFVHTL
jgi:hypothetical protein